jgi:poly-gamma-glutamate synthesis protein (capsule biosynthesis protein)
MMLGAVAAPTGRSDAARRTVSLFLCGDVMTGRGIDQVLPHPSKPHLYEPYVRSALDYVALAEQASGPIARPVDFAYVWGDARTVLDRMRPDARIINLETAVTASEDAWPGKGIHYRMLPANVPCLTAANIDCCVLANNHVLDWGYRGLEETLDTLRAAGIRTAGAGRSEAAAAAPATIELPGDTRVLVFAFGMESAGVLGEWSATGDRPGVNFLADLSPRTADRIARELRAAKRSGDIAVLSLHWGGNWGYHVPQEQRAFAHRIIDAAGADVIHGHSSHHPKGIEIYRDKPILYGCGDLLTDYEGIRGHESYRPDLALMYFATVDAASGRLLRLELAPMQIHRFRIRRAPEDAARWLQHAIDRECRRFGSRVERHDDGGLRLRWR